MPASGAAPRVRPGARGRGRKACAGAGENGHDAEKVATLPCRINRPACEGESAWPRGGLHGCIQSQALPGSGVRRLKPGAAAPLYINTVNCLPRLRTALERDQGHHPTDEDSLFGRGFTIRERRASRGRLRKRRERGADAVWAKHGVLRRIFSIDEELRLGIQILTPKPRKILPLASGQQRLSIARLHVDSEFFQRVLFEPLGVALG